MKNYFLVAFLLICGNLENHGLGKGCSTKKNQLLVVYLKDLFLVPCYSCCIFMISRFLQANLSSFVLQMTPIFLYKDKTPGGVSVGCMNGYIQSLWLYLKNTNLMLTQYSMTNGVTFPC